MSTYKYRDEWRVSYAYDCNFFVTCRTLRDAIWIAALRNEDSLISGETNIPDTGQTVKVAVRLHEIKGRTFDDIFAMLDQRVAQHLASLAVRGLEDY